MTQDLAYIIDTFEALVNIPSPSGFTQSSIEYVEKAAISFGYSCERTEKGGLIITVPGKSEDTIGLSAHIDTLGAMVRSINESGTLNLLPIGGYMMEAIEGTYCKIHTRDGRTYTGTISTTMPSVHTYDDAKNLERVPKNMIVTIDECVSKKADVLNLGIQSGDFISLDPCFVHTESGFIKSRHIDDKASVAVLLGVLKNLSDQGSVPKNTLKFVISNYEEIGHGSSYIPSEIKEFLAVDMGAIGADLNGDEYTVSICAMDSSGPYDYELTNRLIKLAQENGIDYAIDIFPHYGSDVSAALRGGSNIRGALIGQGVHASHGIERTHEKGLQATFQLVMSYIETGF